MLIYTEYRESASREGARIHGMSILSQGPPTQLTMWNTQEPQCEQKAVTYYMRY